MLVVLAVLVVLVVLLVLMLLVRRPKRMNFIFMYIRIPAVNSPSDPFCSSCSESGSRTRCAPSRTRPTATRCP